MKLELNEAEAELLYEAIQRNINRKVETQHETKDDYETLTREIKSLQEIREKISN